MRRKSEKGQSLVEFALILPLMLLLLCAVVDYGWLFTHELVLSSAVRDGARVGITCTEDSGFATQVRSRVRQECGIFDQNHLSVVTYVHNGDVVVNAAYDLPMLTPMAAVFVGGMSYHMDAGCTMRAE